MLVSRCAVPFSLGTFFKHLPVSNPTTLCPYRFRPKTLTATAIRSFSYFETLDSRQKEQVHLYVDTLLQWNQKMNLTAVKEADEVMERHIEDSLAIIPPIRNSYFSHCKVPSESLSLVDVGERCRSSGVDLSHCLPRLGSDPHGVYEQAMRFLGACCRSHWFVECSSCKRKSRGQNLGQALCFREKFDVAVARAVAEMRVLAEYCLPLVCVGGLFVAAKGHDPQDEVKNAEKSNSDFGCFHIATMHSGIAQPVWTKNCHRVFEN